LINRFGEVIGIVNGKYTDASDRCATFATAISEAENLIAQANNPGRLDQGRDRDSTGKPMVTQAVCPNVGCRAPDFTLSSIDGKSLSMQSLKGKKSILIFTGADYSLLSRSQECLTKLYGSWPRGQLEILLVVRQKDTGDPAGWVKANGIKFPVLWAEGEAPGCIRLMPSLFISSMRTVISKLILRWKALLIVSMPGNCAALLDLLIGLLYFNLCRNNAN
jgi:hypothetical protein